MKGKRIIVFAASVLLLIPSLSALAGVNVKWGTYLRLRNEYWKNWFNMSKNAKTIGSHTLGNREFFRIKASIWGKFGFGDFMPNGMDIAEGTSLFVKMTDEFRPYVYPSHRGDIGETVFDNLYLDAKNIFGLPIDARIGRQNFLFTYGEGFLIMDGTPQDGSRTYYFNAAKFTWHINDKNSLDFVYMKQNRTDDMLPIINEMDAIHITDGQTTINDSNETGYVLYLKSRAIKNTYLEGYYIFKDEPRHSATSALEGQNSHIHTIGSYVRYKFDPYTLRGQFATQFGDYGSNDREGYGGYLFLDRVFKDAKWSPKASIGYLYLSGDDQSTNKNEGWDPLFSRWPWMSELYVLTNITETGTGPGYWTNLNMLRMELALKPTKKSKLRFWYNVLGANETVSASTFSGSEKDRGNLYQARFDYKFTKNIAGYILAEYFVPGDFYAPSNRDEAMFLRTELTFKF